MGRRADEAVLAEQDVNFNVLIRGQIRREIQSEIRGGIKNLLAQFAQILSVPRRRRGQVAEEEASTAQTRSRASLLVTKLARRERERKRGGNAAYNEFAGRAHIVLRKKCAECGSPSPPLHILRHPTKPQAPSARAKEFLHLLNISGVRAVRKRFRLLCTTCIRKHNTTQGIARRDARQGQLLGVLGKNCEDCRKPPKKLHIISPRSGGKYERSFEHYQRSLILLAEKHGPQWFKAHYIHRCRMCFNKAKGILHAK